MEIHNAKFICKVYMNGEIENQCKIWIGGLLSSDSIAYIEGSFDINNDNSINDFFTIEVTEYEMGFKPSTMGYLDPEFEEIGLLNKEQLARYLWRKFTKSMR